MTTDSVDCSKSQQMWRWATRAALHCWLSAMPWCHQWRQLPRNPMRACHWTALRPGWMRTAWTSSTIGSHRTSQWPLGTLVLLWNSVQSTHSVHTHACTRTYTCLNIQACTKAYTQTCMHTCTHACMCARAHTHIHMHMHACTHTHTHMIPLGVCSVVTGSEMNK